MNRLFVMLLKDSLTEYAYDAELAGLKYNVDVSIYGIIVSRNLEVTGIMNYVKKNCAILDQIILVFMKETLMLSQ